jgi:hypothetical protein
MPHAYPHTPHWRACARARLSPLTLFKETGEVVEKETASFADFASRLGCKRSYVTELRKADRLVLTEDGKAVCVVESLARIEATRDPSKIGVADRHAAARKAGQGLAAAAADEPQQAAEAAQPAPGESPDATVDDTAPDEGFQYWRRRSEKARALAAERDNAIAEGKLLDAGEVTAAVAGGVTALRARLETLPDTLGPQLAAISDEPAARALLAEAIEHVLEELSRQFTLIGKAGSP